MKSPSRRESARTTNALRPIRTCPLCGSRRVRRRLTRVELKDERVVEKVPVDHCANCGEQFFDPAALRLISAGRHPSGAS